MFNISVEGFDELQRQLDEVSDAIAALDGDICQVKVNPNDPADVERAIAEMENAVDVKISRFRDNPWVNQIADAAKKRFREELLNRVQNAKSEHLEMRSHDDEEKPL